MIVRLFPLLLALLALALAPALAPAAGDGGTVTVTTSLGAVQKDDERNLRARGKAPAGSVLTVRFYRGSKLLDKDRTTVRDGRYKAFTPIARTGSYRVKVTAKTRSGETVTVTARLAYGPRAEAPSAPEGDSDD